MTHVSHCKNSTPILQYPQISLIPISNPLVELQKIILPMKPSTSQLDLIQARVLQKVLPTVLPHIQT